MAVSQQQKVDFLLKKLGFTKTKTGLAVDSTLTGTKKAGFAEAIPSPLIIANSSVWNEADSIPATPPGSDTNQVKVYLAVSSGHRMTVDSTVAGNRAFIAFSTYNDTSSTRLNNWIDTQFGAGYLIKVFKGDPNSGGVQLSAAGSGANDGWFFDYSAGVLNFNDTSVPSGVTGTNIYIVGYRYIGQTGAPTSGISTFSFLDLSVERNLDVGVQGGISTFRNNIDLNADLDVDGHTNLDNLSVAGVTTTAGLLDINAGGQANTFKVEDLTDNRVVIAGTGGELEDSGNLTFDGTTLGLTGSQTVSGDIDVDGHTNLDNVSVSGVTTFAGNVKANSHINLPDNSKIKLGDSDEFRIHHDNAGNSYIVEGGTGNLFINAEYLRIQDAVGNNKLRTSTVGVNIPQDLDVDGHTNLDNISVAGVTTFASNVYLGDNDRIYLGDSDDLQIFHRSSDGTSLIEEVGSGNLALVTNGTYIDFYDSANNRSMARFYTGGACEFKHGATTRLVTTSTGVTVSGTVVADGADINGDLDVDGHTNLDNISVAGVSTFTGDATFAGNVSIGGTLTYEDVTNVDSVGLLTARSGIRVTGGVIEALAGENKIPSLYANMAALPSAGSYHGMFAHVHATGRGYFAHAGNWLELVNKEVNGVVGTGTERYNIGPVDLTTLDVSGISTFAGNIDINADIDVDGHTNLDNVSVSGILTAQNFDYTSNTNIRIGDDAAPNATTNRNVAIGDDALKVVASHNNVAIGYAAGESASSGGGGNVLIGRLSGNNLTTNVATFVGSLSGQYQTGAYNSSFGASALQGSNGASGTHNTAMGFWSQRVSTSSENTSLGSRSLKDLTSSSNQNTAIGAYTLHSITSNSSENTVLGYRAGDALVTGSNNIIIGHEADASTTTTSNEITLGDANITHLRVPGIGVSFNSTAGTQLGIITATDLDISGDIDVDGHTNLDNVSIAGVTTVANDTEFIFGSNATATRPLKIKHQSSNTRNQLTANYIDFNVSDARFENISNGAQIAQFFHTSVNLFYSGTQRFSTAPAGANVYGNLQIQSNQPNLLFIDENADNDFSIKCDGGSLQFVDSTESYTTRMSINSSGNVSIVKDLDVDGHTNLDNVSIAGVTTFTGNIGGTATFNDIDVDGHTNLDNVDIVGVTTHYDKVLIRQIGSTNSTNVVPLEVQAYKGDTTTGITTVLFTSTFAKRPEFIFSNSHNGNWNNSNGQTQHWRMLWKAPNEADTTDEVVELKPYTDVGGALSSFGIRVTDNSTGLKNSAYFNHQQVALYANNTLGLRVSQAGIGITDTIYHEGDTNTKIRFPANDTIRFETAGSQRLNIASNGNVSVNNNLDVSGDLDVDGHTNLDNVSIAGVTTTTGDINIDADNKKLQIGDGQELQLVRTGTYSNIYNATGDLDISSDVIRLKNGNRSKTYAAFINGGQAELYFDNSRKITTTTTGINVTGLTDTDTLLSSGNATFSGTITAGGATGTNGQYLKSTGSGVAWASFPTLRTRNTFTASAGQTTFSFSYTVNFLDVFVNGIKLTDAEFTASNGSSVVLAVGCFVGDIVELVSYNTVSGGGGGGGSLNNIVEDTTPQLGGNLDLFNKSITGTGGINITGVVTATTFIGDGSGLTGIVASGSGVVVKNSGSTVGTAGTINFGNNLSVTPISAGIVTITGFSGITTNSGIVSIANDLDVDGHTNLDNVNIAGVTTMSGALNANGNIVITSATPYITFDDTNNRNWQLNADGGNFIIKDTTDSVNRLVINSSGNVSINNDLDVDGHTNLDNVSIAGVVTATTFSGSGASLTGIANVNIASNAAIAGTKITPNFGSQTINSDNGAFLGGNLSISNVAPKIFLTDTDTDSDFSIRNMHGVFGIHDQTNSVNRLTISSSGNVSILKDLDVDGHTELDNVNIAGVVTATTFKGSLEATSASFSSNIDANGDLDVDGHTNLDNVSVAGVVTATTFKGALEATSASFSSNIDANGDLDVDGHTNLDNVSISGVSTATGGSVFGLIQAGVGALNATIQKTDNTSLHLQYDKPGNLALCNGGGTVIAHNNFSVVGYSTMTNGAELGRLIVGYGNLYLTVQPRSGENTLHFNYNNGTEVRIGEGQTRSDLIVKGDIEPRTDSAFDLGTTSVRWRNVYADNFVGDGSGLTGITASGSGIVIKHDGSTVGTAGTINFGTNLDVSAISAGIVTVTASGGGATDSISEGNTKAEVSDTGTNGRFFVETEGTEKFSIDSTGDFKFNQCNDSEFNANGNLTLDYKSSNTLRLRQQYTSSAANFILFNVPLTIWNNNDDATTMEFHRGDRIQVGTGSSISVNGNIFSAGIVTATSFVGDGSNLTGIDAGVGITTNLSGTFTASAGSPSTINTFGYGSGDIVVEYTVFIKNGSNYQSQKLLAMRDGTTIHSTQFAIMYSSSLLVQLDATISSGNILLRATPETGVSGSTTYKVKREVM